MGMPSERTNNFPESGRGIGHMTPTIFGSTVGYPSDSLASCIYELQRWKFLSAANKFCDRFSCLYNLQSHTVSELKIRFGDNDSVGRMKQLLHIYFGRLFE